MFVGDGYVVRRARAPEVHRGGDTGDDARADPSVVGGVEVDAERDPFRGGVEHRAEGAERFGQRGGGTAVEQAYGW